MLFKLKLNNLEAISTTLNRVNNGTITQKNEKNRKKKQIFF